MRDEQSRLETRSWIDNGAASAEMPSSVFRAFVDALPESVVWLNRDAEILYVNAAFLEDFDKSWDEAIGSCILDFVTGTDRAEMKERLDRAFALTPDAPTRTEEFAGKKEWLSSVFNGVFSSDGELVAVTELARNHSAERDAQVALEASNRRLAESNRDLQDFAYIASHDLQEPLRKISAFGDRLATKYSDSLDERGLDYLARIRGASERMQVLIDDVLTFSRVATHGQDSEWTEVGPVIEGVLEDLEMAISESHATVTVAAMPTLPVDPSQLRQLFQNLLGNALKFRQADVAPEITVAATAMERPSEMGMADQVAGWSITVSDNGIGFEEKYRDKIFTVFQRLHNRTAYAGSGVGLSVCRRIAERHGGMLTATSELGNGSTFTVWLPTEPVNGPLTDDPAEIQRR